MSVCILPKSLKETIISTVGEFIKDREISLTNEQYLAEMLKHDAELVKTDFEKSRIRKLQSENQTLISAFQKDIKLLSYLKEEIDKCEARE